MKLGLLETPYFYVHLPQGADKMIGAPLDARILLPLKSLAFGVPSHAFRDYFQMSYTLACDYCQNFNQVIINIYKEAYTRLPTPSGLKAIFELHKHEHKINGMGGSLDCMYMYPKIVPWHGKVILMVREKDHLLCWKLLVIITYGFDIHCMDIAVL